MKIIDAHTHIYPDKIAVKASSSIGSFYDVPVCYDGTTATLLEVGDAAGVDKFVVHSVATVPKQVTSINKFVASQVEEHPDRFIGFATMHPGCENIPELVDEAVALGLHGIKLHPDFQEFNVDSPEAMKIYESAEGRLPVLVHAGDFRTQYSKAFRIVNVMKAFPKLDVIAAHMGGWSEWGDDAEALAACGVYVDTSSTLQMCDDLPKIRRLMDLFGAEHIFFGSDYPMWDAADERRIIETMFASDDEREKIYHLSFEALMKKYGFEV